MDVERFVMELQLQRLRKAAGLNQQEMAKKLGIKYRTYGSWERGEVAMSFPQAIACAEILGCTTDELAGRKVSRSFADKNQEALNSCYESMNDKGKEMLVGVARSLEKDTANRIIKEGAEYLGDTAILGA